MNDFQAKFLTLYEPVHEAFSRFCHARAYGLMEAEDLISETVLCALEQFHTIKKEEAFLSFLFSVATNILRKKNRRLKFSSAFHQKEVEQIKDQGIDAGMRLDIGLLYEALNELPLAQKEALTLFEISGFSIKEVAEIQQASVDAVKQRLKRGRAALAVLLNCDQLSNETPNKRSGVLMTIFL